MVSVSLIYLNDILHVRAKYVKEESDFILFILIVVTDQILEMVNRFLIDRESR